VEKIIRHEGLSVAIVRYMEGEVHITALGAVDFDSGVSGDRLNDEGQREKGLYRDFPALPPQSGYVRMNC
jgi:hypothetical protein